MIISEKSRKKVIPIASGKGGVGKSLIAANLAISLAEGGKETVVVDLDLGGSNLHTCLGIKNTNIGIGNILAGKSSSFRDILVSTPYENLKFVPGDVLVTGTADITPAQRKKLIEGITSIRADYIILDLGAGSSAAVLDFFGISNSGLIVTTSQAPSVLNAFGLLKNLVFQQLLESCGGDKDLERIIRTFTREKSPGKLPSVTDIYDTLKEKKRNADKKAKKALENLKPKIIINMADSPEDLDIGIKLRNLVKSSLDIEIECMGLLYYEQSVKESLEELTPHVIDNPESTVSRGIRRMAQKVLLSENFPIMPLDLEYYKDTFELTQIEAENDFADIEELRRQAPDEEIDMGELFQIITAQKQEIQELKNTIRMISLGRGV